MVWRVFYSRNSTRDFNDLSRAKQFLRQYTEGSIFEYHENAHPSLRLILRYIIQNHRIMTVVV